MEQILQLRQNALFWFSRILETGHNVNHFLKEVGRELPYLIYFPLKEIEY
jgi:hypothetical protein